MPLDAANQTLNTKLKTERARFTDKTRNSSPVPVHFNPVSLQVTISNTLEEKGQGKDKKQYVSKSTAKLSMDLVFDSTDSGQDVRLATGKLAKLMEPVGEQESCGACRFRARSVRQSTPHREACGHFTTKDLSTPCQVNRE